MKTLSKILLNCSLFAMLPVFANAAGTYYNNSLYQSPQTTRYNRQTYTQTQRTGGISAYNQNRYGNSGYTAYSNTQNRNTYQNQNRTNTQKQSSDTKRGFTLDAGLSHQMSSWNFEMANAGSILRWDDLNWNVFDVNGKYVFGNGKTPMQIAAGIKYGMQSGETSMIDDDITNGGIPNPYYAYQITNALSAGTTSDGTMFGYNIEFGLTDFFKWGNARITPSIGWRSHSYKLENKNNYGIAMDIVNNEYGCWTVPEDGSIQCDPALVMSGIITKTVTDANGDKWIEFYTVSGTEVYLQRIPEYGNLIPVPDQLLQNDQGETGEFNAVDPEGSFYFYQPGVSHSYEVEWAGPYLALDMSYLINQYNQISGRIELGLPSYNAVGDQPGRPDMQHPKSIEDDSGIGDAFHFGLGANWSTAISDTVALSIGLTYDYYTVSDATAKTYVNPTYYQDAYNSIFSAWQTQFPDVPASEVENYMLNGVIVGDTTLGPDPEALYIKSIENNGWVLTDENEISSVFKSMGIRVGINARF
jgi:hypothetical protein